jgi:hypothetical protein
MNLNNSYSRVLFLEIITGLDKSFTKLTQKIDFESKVISKAFRLGHMETAGIDVIEIEVNDNIKNRISITREAFRLLKLISTPNAIISFFTSKSNKWRISLLTTDYEVQNGSIKVNFSNPRRYSYLLGENTKINTPNRYLISKGQIQGFEDLKSRFSLEVVNKDFYQLIAESFTELIGGNRKFGKDLKFFPGILSIKGKVSNNLEHQEFAVRLIGRLLFCWFLREKRSKDGLGVSLIPKEIFGAEEIKKNPKYYNSVIEILFFEILNTKHTDRKKLHKTDILNLVPYLNGGLFNPHAKDYYSGNSNTSEVIIPNQWFNRIFEVFEKYNFTVDENTSYDVELSIDPEMLGRIFENLLAEINPDTGESARKSTGSFYTPRNVVDYMIGKSLYYYLKKTTKIDEEKIKIITSDGFGLQDNDFIKIEEKKDLIKALINVKTIDPACGSGAFPIGLLQKLVHIFTVVDQDSKIWMEELLISRKLEEINYFRTKITTKGFLYIRKLQIIKDSIYGVDIQPIATEISKLRCFLTLIVDEIIEDDQPNRGIEPLPNLEFKFVAANSLIRLDSDPIIKKASELNLFEDISHEIKLKSLREKYFISNSIERLQIQKDFVKIQTEMKNSLQIESNSGVSKKLIHLIEWNPFSNFETDWLDIDWMFGVSGFDIVIQNPPYVSTKSIEPKDKKKLIDSYGFVDDLYNHFIYRGLELLNSNGVQTVISSDTYFTTETKKQLRKDILNHHVHSFIFLGYNVFESAMVSTAIAIIEKTIGSNSGIEIVDAKKNKDLNSSNRYYSNQKIFKETINNAIFIPNKINLSIHNKLSKDWNYLNSSYGRFISTSQKISKYRYEIDEYLETINNKIYTLMGLVTDGGQGLATANNGKYVGVIEDSKEAIRITETRVKKLNEFNKKFKKNYAIPNQEAKIWELFDSLKEKYGRDIFGKGFLYKIVPKRMLANLSGLSEDEKINGISSISTFVPYDKGDKDGNRWYLLNPYYISWSKEYVKELKNNAGKKEKGSSRYQNPQFYFKEGFCYSDIKTHYIKARLKPISIHDIKSMSLFSTNDYFPTFYLVLILNSSIVAEIVENFINNTQTFQINDARFLPIPVPSLNQLRIGKEIFDKALRIQKDFFEGKTKLIFKNTSLADLQNEVDKFVLNLYNL